MKKLLQGKYLIALMLIIFIFAGSAFAADIDLGEGYHVPSGFASVLITNSNGTAIQNAVEHIKDGGTIFLSGSFNLVRSINIKKNITIKTPSSASAILDAASANDRVIRCQGNITLENLVIKGGNSTNGGGVKVDGGQVNIISCDINSNKSILGGGGIHSQAVSLTITNCNISNNSVAAFGGGISSWGSGTVTINNSKFTGNTAATGGGLAAMNTITMNNCQVTGNSAKQNGGGIYISSANLTTVNCDISGNTAAESADIALDDGAILK